MSSKECKDDKGVIFDISEGDVGTRFDGVQVTIIGDLGYDYSGCFFTYYDTDEKREVWDYARNFTWPEGAEAKLPNRNFSWVTSPRRFIYF